MLPRSIKSLQHPLVKYFVKLRENAHFREQEDVLIVTGKNILSEIPIHTLILQEGEDSNLNAQKKIFVSSDVMKKISGTVNPEPIAGLIKKPKFFTQPNFKLLLALDQISDPGNLGTLIRSALALNWDSVFLLNGCCDPFNSKAIRASKGAIFKIPINKGDWDDLIKLKGIFYAADMIGQEASKMEFKAPLILVLGNESQGISNITKEKCIPISIKMSSSMESLNVAAAGAILMHEIRGKI